MNDRTFHSVKPYHADSFRILTRADVTPASDIYLQKISG